MIDMLDSIYLDNQATTPTDPRVLRAIAPFLDLKGVGNPHSEHFAGRRAAEAVEDARAKVAALINACSEEVIFTSGATEANNIALQGIMRSRHRRGNHMITCVTEHKCVLETAAFLSREGYRVDVLPVDEEGRIDIERLRGSINEETALVSIMMANNEIGVLQPIAEIAALCRARGIVFHTDAAQAVGKVPIDVKALGVDLMSLSGHKIYAPIGVGALFIGEDSPVWPEPLFWGGKQERGLRSGTLAPHLCVAFGEASALALTELKDDAERTLTLRSSFVEIVRAALPDIRVNAEHSPRLPGSLSIIVPGVDADRLLGALQPHVAVSTNAACSSGVLQPSHVLLALGLSEEEAASTLRIGFGRFNTAAEVEAAARLIAETAVRIRRSESAAKEAAA